jgi:hypothetical protein
MLKFMTFHEISLEEIDFENETFRISEELDSASVLNSLRRIGQLNPILLLDRSAQKTIVSGFRRLRALKQLGSAQALARILEDGDSVRIFTLALWDNLSHRQLTDLEKARVLFKLKNVFGLSMDALMQEYLPILGLPPRESVLKTYLQIDGMNLDLRKFLLEGKLTLSSIERLAVLPQDQQDRIVFHYNKMRLSASLQRQVLDLLEELAVMTGRRMDAILDEPEMKEILDDVRLSPFQRGERLHASLYRKRNPRISQAADRYRAQKILLDLPGSIRITADPFFETTGLHVEFDASGVERFREMATALQKASLSPALDDLYKMID